MKKPWAVWFLIILMVFQIANISFDIGYAVYASDAQPKSEFAKGFQKRFLAIHGYSSLSKFTSNEESSFVAKRSVDLVVACLTLFFFLKKWLIATRLAIGSQAIAELLRGEKPLYLVIYFAITFTESIKKYFSSEWFTKGSGDDR